MPYDNETIREPRCPKCDGHLWDNRATKRNPKQPDYKCKDKQCDGVIWPPRDAAPRGVPQPAVKPLSTQGKEPYSAGPRIEGIDGPVNTAKLDTLFSVYGACMDHVLDVIVPKLDRAKIGASPESVGAMTATLLIQASKL
jgi:hypothetical protein